MQLHVLMHSKKTCCILCVQQSYNAAHIQRAAGIKTRAGHEWKQRQFSRRSWKLNTIQRSPLLQSYDCLLSCTCHVTVTVCVGDWQSPTIVLVSANVACSGGRAAAMLQPWCHSGDAGARHGLMTASPPQQTAWMLGSWFCRWYAVFWLAWHM
jgi:hypothetical protein